MKPSQSSPRAVPSPALAAIQAQVHAFIKGLRPHRVLVIGPGPEAGTWLPQDHRGQVVSLPPAGDGGGPGVRCDIERLPFVSRVFDVVIAVHVLCDGAEGRLGEIARVLEGGGFLLVLGQGYWRRRLLNSGADPRHLAIRPMRLCRVLAQRGFTVEHCFGTGLGGSGLSTGAGWSKPLLGVSEAILVRARHRGQERIVTPLRIGRPRAASARSAALDGWNREAAS